MATLVQITCMHDCRLLQKHSKVKIGSQTRIKKPGMGFVHGNLSQQLYFLSCWPGAAPGLIWPKLHVHIIIGCFRSTPKVTLLHNTDLQSLGWELCMVFSSKHTIYGQADLKIWLKMTNSGATLAKITRLYGCRQLQKHSKVKIGSQSRIMTTGMGILHGMLRQPQHFLPSWPLIWPKTSSYRADLA